MKKFAIILLAVAMVASAAVAAEKPVWQKGDPVLSRGLLDCTNALPVQCGVLISGDTTNGTDVVDQYNPFGYFQQLGPEVVYELVLDGPDCYDVTGTISNFAPVDLDIYILGSCEENDSLDFGNSTFTIEGLAAGTYYIVVDGYQDTDFGPLDLLVDCVPVACPADPCENIVAAVEGVNSNPGAPVYYSFTSPGAGCIFLSSCIEGQFVDTVVELYDVCEGTIIASNDDMGSANCPDGTGLASFLNVEVGEGQELIFKWRNFGSGTTPFDWTLGYAPDCVVATEEASWGSIKSLYR